MRGSANYYNSLKLRKQRGLRFEDSLVESFPQTQTLTLSLFYFFLSSIMSYECLVKLQITPCDLGRVRINPLLFKNTHLALVIYNPKCNF